MLFSSSKSPPAEPFYLLEPSPKIHTRESEARSRVGHRV